MLDLSTVSAAAWPYCNSKACKCWEPSTSSERQPSTVLVNYFAITSNAAIGLLFGHKEAAKCKSMPGCSSELILNLTPKICSSHQHKKWTLVREQCHPHCGATHNITKQTKQERLKKKKRGGESVLHREAMRFGGENLCGSLSVPLHMKSH